MLLVKIVCPPYWNCHSDNILFTPSIIWGFFKARCWSSNLCVKTRTEANLFQSQPVNQSKGLVCAWIQWKFELYPDSQFELPCLYYSFSLVERDSFLLWFSRSNSDFATSSEKYHIIVSETSIFRLFSTLLLLVLAVNAFVIFIASNFSLRISLWLTVNSSFEFCIQVYSASSSVNIYFVPPAIAAVSVKFEQHLNITRHQISIKTRWSYYFKNCETSLEDYDISGPPCTDTTDQYKVETSDIKGWLCSKNVVSRSL